MKSFLEKVVEDLLQTSHQLQDFCWILPSKRGRIFIQKHIAERVQKTLFLPEILSIEELLEKMVPLKIASNTVLIFELYETYLQEHTIKNKDNFTVFAKWASILLQDFNEIDRYLINASQIFREVTAIEKINHWTSEGTTPIIENYISFIHNLYPLYVSYKNRLLEQQIAYSGMVYREAAKQIDTYCQNYSHIKHVFIGFNALNKAEEIIFQTLLHQNKAKIYWDIDTYFMEDTTHKAGYFIRKYKNWHYHQQYPIDIGNNYRKPKNIKIIGVPKYSPQAQYVSHLLNNELKNKRENTVVVLGDEKLVTPVIQSITPNIERINITMGYPLRKSGVISLFYHFFELYIKATEEGWHYKNIIAILSHPIIQNFIRYHKSKSSVIWYIQQIHQKNEIYWNIKKTRLLLEGLPKVLLTLFEKEQQINRRIVDFATLTVALKESLEANQREEVLQIEHLYRCYQLFNQFISWNTKYPHIKTYRDGFRIFKELIRLETLHFEGEPLSGLQLMGLLESRNLDFENVIITGLNEGILPMAKSNNSFLPFDVKKAYQLPTYEDIDAIYTYHFYRLLQRAKNVFLLYNTEPNVLEGGERSRFISQLLTDAVETHHIEHCIASPKVQYSLSPPRTITKDSFLIAQLKNKAQKGFSPSALTNYIRNPLDFFEQTILGIQNSDFLEETIALNTFGTIIHDSLEKLYTPYIGKELQAKSLQKVLKEVPAVVKHFFRHHYIEKDSIIGKNKIAMEVANKYIEMFIIREIKSLSTNKIRLVALEQELQYQIAVEGIPHPIMLRGIVDRVDEFNGTLRIIDYKTGQVTSANVEILHWQNLINDYKYSKAFQVLFYAFLYTRGVVCDSFKAGIFSFKNLQSGFLSFAKKEQRQKIKEDFITPETMKEFEQQLHVLLLEIFNKNIPLVEKEV